MMTKTLTLVAAGGVLLLTASGAQAATTGPLACSYFASVPTELSGAMVQCPKFDQTLGTLTGINLNIHGDIGGTITLHNNGEFTNAGSGLTVSYFNISPLSGFALPSIFNPNLPGFETFVAFMSTGSQTLAPGGDYFSPPMNGFGDTGNMNNTTVFAPYEAPTAGSFFNVFASTDTALTISGGGGQFGGSQSTFAGFTGTVGYIYNALDEEVPEPASLGLLGAGLAGLGLARRRAKKA